MSEMRQEPRTEGLQFRHGTRSALGRISAAGWMTHGGMNEWRDLGHYASAFVLKGKGIYEDERGSQIDVESGSLIFCFPGLKHYYRPAPGTEWTEFYLIFDGPVIDLWEQQGLLDRNVPVVSGFEPAEVWTQRLEGVLGPSRFLGVDPPLVEICRLQALLADVVCRSSDKDRRQDQRWIKRAKALLETGLHSRSPIDKVAASMGEPAYVFRRRFQSLAGMTPTRYRMIRMIDRACELIQSTRLLDKQIAHQLGFCDEFYFSRRFKEVTGKSPREFRAQLPTPGPGAGPDTPR